MRFSRPNRRLQDTFPPSEQGLYPIPTEVGDNVSLVHPYPGREWERTDSAQLSTQSSVTPTAVLLNQGQNPEFAKWIEVIYGDISHNSATARAIQLRLLSPLGFNVFIGRWTNFETALGVGVPSGFEPLFGPVHGQNGAVASQTIHPPWPLVIPPGYSLAVDGNTAGAAYVITLGLIFIRHELAGSPLVI